MFMACRPYSTVIGGVATALAVGCVVFFSLHRGQLALRWGVTAGAAVASGVLAALVLRCINNQQKEEGTKTKPLKAVVVWQGAREEGGGQAVVRNLLCRLKIEGSFIHIDDLPATLDSSVGIFCLRHVGPRSPEGSGGMRRLRSRLQDPSSLVIVPIHTGEGELASNEPEPWNVLRREGDLLTPIYYPHGEKADALPPQTVAEIEQAVEQIKKISSDRN